MTDWKNNTAIAAIASGGIVLTTTLLVVFSYVIPVYQLADKNTILELKIDKNNQDKISASNTEKIKSLTTENEKLKKETQRFQDYFLTLTSTSAFQKGQSLPIGFSKVYPGMKLSDIYNNYNKLQVIPSDRGSYLTVNANIAGIGQIVYYASNEETPDKITHIYVNKINRFLGISDADRVLAKSIENLSLFDLLKENLGEPIKCGAKSYIWHTKNSPYYTYLNSLDSNSYSIWGDESVKPGLDKECILIIGDTVY